MSWKNKPPYIPDKNHPSKWYWYYDKEEDDYYPVEVYSGCWRLYSGGLWWEYEIESPEQPPKSKKTKRKTKK